MNHKISYLLVILLILSMVISLFPRCANIVPPTGGPRDSIPPKVVSSTPSNYSTGISGTDIQIEFDEFIQLRNINQQFIITPPQTENPEFRVRGKNLYIDLKTELIPNTTYTLNFGDAIVDLNEGNPYSNFEFVFSTGDVIDSLSFSGIVLNAFDNQPAEDVIVMLYNELQDSIPYKQIPLYANRTGEDGRFQLNNLRADTFLVFALRDVNNNYLYDRPGEEPIAFRDQFIIPDTLNAGDQINMQQPGNSSLPDSAGINLHDESVPENITGVPTVVVEPEDTLGQINNETFTPPDTLNTEHKHAFDFASGDTLFLFNEETGRQYLDLTERPSREQLLFVFNLPLKEEWTIKPLNFEPPEDWTIVERNLHNDSIIYWITDPGTRNTDNLQFHVTYLATGPSDSLEIIRDTVNMNYTTPRQTRRQEQSAEPEDNLEYDFDIPSEGNQELHKDLGIKFSEPLLETDNEKIRLLTVQDNDNQSHDFELTGDSLEIRKYSIKTDWITGTDYKFTAEPGAFVSIFDKESDSIDFNFTTRAGDHYGRILLTMAGVDTNIIVQLLDEQENVLKEDFLDGDGPVTFDYLQPQKYRLKVIIDTNNNNQWDPGDYLKGIQPERTVFYGEIIATRSNWDIEVAWDLQQ